MLVPSGLREAAAGLAVAGGPCLAAAGGAAAPSLAAGERLAAPSLEVAGGEGATPPAAAPGGLEAAALGGKEAAEPVGREARERAGLEAEVAVPLHRRARSGSCPGTCACSA